MFFVRSFTRNRVLKRGWARGTRIKPAMEVVSVHYPHSFGRETGTWNNKTRGRASQRFPFGPWPFVAILGCCKQFKKATTEWRFCIWLYITTTTHWLLYIWRKIRGRKKSPIFRTQRWARIRKRGEIQTVLLSSLQLWGGLGGCWGRKWMTREEIWAARSTSTNRAEHQTSKQQRAPASTRAEHQTQKQAAAKQAE